MPKWEKRWDGKNLSYTSVVGNVAPDYFSNPNEDEGRLYGLHGNVGNIPAEYIYHTEDTSSIEVHAIVKDHAILGKKFSLYRSYTISKTENTI